MRIAWDLHEARSNVDVFLVRHPLLAIIGLIVLAFVISALIWWRPGEPLIEPMKPPVISEWSTGPVLPA